MIAAMTAQNLATYQKLRYFVVSGHLPKCGSWLLRMNRAEASWSPRFPHLNVAERDLGPNRRELTQALTSGVVLSLSVLGFTKPAAGFIV